MQDWSQTQNIFATPVLISVLHTLAAWQSRCQIGQRDALFHARPPA